MPAAVLVPPVEMSVKMMMHLFLRCGFVISKF